MRNEYTAQRGKSLGQGDILYGGNSDRVGRLVDIKLRQVTKKRKKFDKNKEKYSSSSLLK